jgi:hypothetical protein
MRLQEAINFFKNLKKESSKNSETKVYEKFLQILTSLKTRKFSKNELESIESKLDDLDLNSNPGNRKKHFRKALTDFERFLKNRFFLTTRSYYTSLGVGLGSAFGIIFGIVILSNLERSLGIALGLVIGAAFGFVIGRSMDAQVKSSGNIL